MEKQNLPKTSDKGKGKPKSTAAKEIKKTPRAKTLTPVYPMPDADVAEEGQKISADEYIAAVKAKMEQNGEADLLGFIKARDERILQLSEEKEAYKKDNQKMKSYIQKAKGKEPATDEKRAEKEDKQTKSRKKRKTKDVLPSESGEKVAEEILLAVWETVKCPICSKVFIDPFSLNCGHSFCRVCLEDSYKYGNCEREKSIIACPSCREAPTKLPSYNFTLNQVVETLMEKLSKTDFAKNKEIKEGVDS